MKGTNFSGGFNSAMPFNKMVVGNSKNGMSMGYSVPNSLNMQIMNELGKKEERDLNLWSESIVRKIERARKRIKELEDAQAGTKASRDRIEKLNGMIERQAKNITEAQEVLKQYKQELANLNKEVGKDNSELLDKYKAKLNVLVTIDKSDLWEKMNKLIEKSQKAKELQRKGNTDANPDLWDAEWAELRKRFVKLNQDADKLAKDTE